MDVEQSVDGLAREIVGTAGRLSAALGRWLLLIARLDAAAGCFELGFASTAAWLAYSCGLSKRTADDHVRAARTLVQFPALAEAMGSGRLSYSHVRAISRIVKAGESELVDSLIMVAEHGTVAHLETITRGLSTVEDNESASAGQPPEQYVRHSWTSAAQWRLSARLDPENGKVVEAAVAAVAAADGISAADALVRIAERALADVNDSNESRRDLRGDERAAVVIHLDASRLDSARVVDGPGLPDAVVKRLACAGRVRTVLRGKQSRVLDVGRSQRLVTDKQWRALLIRDHGRCGRPGCENTKGLQAHHVIHWLEGGPTDLDNLILLCQPHHLGLHNREFTIAADGRGGFQFIRPDGADIPEHVNPADYVRTDIWLEDEHPDVEPGAARTRWDGQRLDRDYAISVIADARAHYRDRQSA